MSLRTSSDEFLSTLPCRLQLPGHQPTNQPTTTGDQQVNATELRTLQRRIDRTRKLAIGMMHAGCGPLPSGRYSVAVT